MKMIRAVVYDQTTPLGMKIKDIAAPISPPPNGFVNIAVVAAGINPADYKLQSVPILKNKIIGKPVGIDFAGIVISCSANESVFKIGDEVYGESRGTMAQIICVGVNSIALKPKNISFAEAASLPVAGSTALQALRDHGKLTAGGEVLVIGASGGCGFLGVQMAKAFGASRVVGVCSSKNSLWVKETLGADEVHEYDTTGKHLPSTEKKFDVIYDTVTSSHDHNFEPEGSKLLKKKGRYVLINGGAWKMVSMVFKLITRINFGNSTLFLSKVNRADLETIKDMVEKNQVKPFLDEEVPFEDEKIEKAFQKLKSRRTRGKMVVLIPPLAQE